MQIRNIGKLIRKLFNRKPFKWPENPKGRFLAQEYWTEHRIGYCPKFPIIVIDFADSRRIDVFKGFGDIEVRWNHFIFENHIHEDSPTYFVDAEMTLSRLKFHADNFNYPAPEGKLDKDTFLEHLKNCELSNLSDFERLKNATEIFQKLLNKEFRYTWE